MLAKIRFLLQKQWLKIILRSYDSLKSEILKVECQKLNVKCQKLNVKS